MSDEYINMSSTNFTALAEYSSELLEKKKPKILILFSDGGERKDIEKFAKIVKDKEISLYVVLVGTVAGAPVLDKNGRPIRKNGAIAITQRNDALGKVALESGGAFVVAGTGTRAIKDLVKTIKAQHQSRKNAEVTIYDREELFYYPLGFAIFLLLLGFSSLPIKRRSL